MDRTSSATVAPSSADGFTAMFAAKNDLDWSGGDQVTSVAAGGYVYWLFGDSMLSAGEDADGSYPDGTVMVPNRILLQRGGELVNAVTGGGDAAPDPATRTDANLDHYWPQAGFDAGGHLYVLVQRVQADPSSGLGFHSVGVEMAKYRIGSDGLLTLVAVLATPSTGVPGGVGPAHIQWSGDAVVHDGFVYVYGATLAGENDRFIPHFSYVARVPVGQVEDPSAWRYYGASSGQWVERIADLDPDPGTQPDAILPSQVSSARVTGGRWVLLHKPWNGWGSTVFAELSASPVGPWTQHRLFESPAGTWEGVDYVTYSPQLHPEQWLRSGALLVSAAWNGKTLADTMANADVYKPRFYEVRLP